MNFGLNPLYDVGAKPSLLLLDRFGILFDVETVHGYMRIKSRHVFIALNKDIFILSYERYKVLLLSKRQAFAYRDELWVCLITYVNLDYLIFGKKLALFETLLLLKIKLLSPWISIEWLYVFVLLHLTYWRHVSEESFEDNPHTHVRFPIWWVWGVDARNSSDSDSDWVDRVTYPNPLRV